MACSLGYLMVCFVGEPSSENETLRYSLAYIRFVLRYRVAVLCVVGVVTAFSAYSMSRAHFASSIIKLFLGGSPDYARYRGLVEDFGESDVAVLTITDDDLLSEGALERLERVRLEIESHPDVRRVQALTNANQVRGLDDMLEIYPYADWYLEGLGTEEELSQELRDNQMVHGLLLSDDQRTAAYLIELLADEDRPVELLPGFLYDWENQIVDAGFDRASIRRAGMVAESVAATEQARLNIKQLLPITVLVLALVVFVMFFQILPVIITTSISAIALLWTFGIVVWVNPQINLMMAMVPAVMMVVCFSDIIHLISAYRLELDRGHSKEEAILASGAEVGLACFYTSATTFVGFASLAFVPTIVFRNLGFALGLGVAIALLLAMTLVPIVFSYLPKPEPYTRRGSERVAFAVDTFAQACRALATRFPKATAAVFMALIVWSVVGASMLKIETSMIDRLDADHPIQVDRRFIQKHFSGTNFLDIYLSADAGTFKDPKWLSKVREFQLGAVDLDGVVDVASLVNLVEVLHRELKSGTAVADQDFPNDRRLVAQYLMLFEDSGGSGLDRIASDDYSKIRISVRLDHPQIVKTRATAATLEELAAEILGPTIAVEATGLNVLFGKWLRHVLRGQRQGLMFAFFVTALMMTWILRSLGAGLVAMLPNAFPILLLFGYVGWFLDSVDSDALLIAMIAIGIAVDDTIHMLTRLHIEARRGDGLDAAIKRAFAFAGRAIVQTSIILCLGFLPFSTSEYFTTKMMGIFLPITLLLALFADLLLVPALVKLRILRISRPKQVSASPSPSVGNAAQSGA